MTPIAEFNARFRGDDKELLHRVAAWPERPNLDDCSTPKLAELARTQGLDFATALLYGRVLQVPEHASFFERVQASEEAKIPSPAPLVLIVPGAFYREHKNTGADGARIVPLVKELGCPVERVPLRSFGALADNARVIADCLTAHRGRPLVLLTLSKGSADLKIALSRPDAAEAVRDVIAWVSLSGLSQGTPLVAWLRQRPLRWLGVHILLWLRGQRYSVLEELRHEDDGPLSRWPKLPSHLRVIHIVGFPLRRHLSHPFAPRAYERLAPLGPNDGGGFLLGDITKLPGIVFPVWGTDHYFQPAWDATSLLRRVLASAMARDAEFPQASRSASQPSAPPASRSTA